MNRAAAGWGAREFADAVDGLAPVALRAVATLRLADHVGIDGCTLDQLADRCGIPAGRLRRLLAFLVCRGVFAEPETDRYVQSGLSRMLCSWHPSGLQAWLDGNGVGARLDGAVSRLVDTLRLGTSGYELAFGRDFYTDLADLPGAGPSFDELRAGHAESLAAELARELDWSRVGSVVDVGGGAGVLAAALLSAFPGMRACVVDLPGAVAAAGERLGRAAVADRAELVSGSLFEPLPPGADLYVVVNVLHNWPDAEAASILGRCAEVLPAHGRVLVGERPTDRQDPQMSTAMDLRMLSFLGGRERSTAQYAALAAAAGLDVARTVELPSGLAAMYLRPSDRETAAAAVGDRQRP